METGDKIDSHVISDIAERAMLKDEDCKNPHIDKFNNISADIAVIQDELYIHKNGIIKEIKPLIKSFYSIKNNIHIDDKTKKDALDILYGLINYLNRRKDMRL